MTKLILLPFLLAVAASAPAAEVDFAHDIVPLLKKHCGECHTGPQQKGKLSFNTRETILKGGESGAVVVVGKSAKSELVARLKTDDKDTRMPPEGPRLSADKVALIKRWIDAGLPWEQGFTFGPRSYEPPLKPRRVELPPAVDGRGNPVDRIIDAYQAGKQIKRPEPAGDGAYLRRISLDLVGLLPSPDELALFLADKSPDKRARKVRELLDRDVDYAEHWLSFWNDLLRNDYTGTGFITGGRKQITGWLYDALLTNKPYVQFARELIAPPTPQSAGFIEGIRWRGEVSAGQTVEIQFAQSIGQSLLGINLKCASCHDSFIDRWTLAESFGLAAIYSTRPLAIHRCDKPTGQMAEASWLFPELGQVDAKAKQPERLKQLAALMTHPENGRFTRTIVNRIWHRLMGRGIVHPVDAMQTEPWSVDLLDYLATHLSEHQYDLKQTMELIATSAAYQSRAEAVAAESGDFVFRGPRHKRLTAEQLVDAVWQLTETAPAKIDAQITRGKSKSDKDQAQLMVRASLVKNDVLMRSLGRPHREQIVTQRPTELTTLEAMDLSNGQVLAGLLERGAKNLLRKEWKSPDDLAIWLYRSGLSRNPSAGELSAIGEILGNKLTEQGVQDVLWAVLMLPEFQLVR